MARQVARRESPAVNPAYYREPVEDLYGWDESGEFASLIFVNDFHRMAREGNSTLRSGCGYPVRDGRANMDCPILPGRDQDLPLTASHVLWVY